MADVPRGTDGNVGVQPVKISGAADRHRRSHVTRDAAFERLGRPRSGHWVTRALQNLNNAVAFSGPTRA